MDWNRSGSRLGVRYVAILAKAKPDNDNFSITNCKILLFYEEQPALISKL